MNLLSTFGIGANRILAKNVSTTASVTMVQKSYLYVIKKPVRLYISDSNTLYSHFITFRYTVEGILYTGKLFVTPYHRCPQKGEKLEIYYDPENPKKYAFYAFPPASKPMGW